MTVHTLSMHHPPPTKQIIVATMDYESENKDNSGTIMENLELFLDWFPSWVNIWSSWGFTWWVRMKLECSKEGIWQGLYKEMKFPLKENAWSKNLKVLILNSVSWRRCHYWRNWSAFVWNILHNLFS